MESDDQHNETIIIIVLCVCFSHYGLPFIHYCCMGACRKKTADVGKATIVATIDVENQYKMSDSDVKEVFKADKSVIRVLSMHFTFWVYAWFTYFVVTTFMEQELFSDMKEIFVCNLLGYINVPIFVLFLWIEMFFSWESDYLKNMFEEKTFKMYTQELIEERPVVTFTVVAYHYETKTRTVSGTSGNRTEKYQERMNDYKESQEFPINRWVDLSPNPNTLTLDYGKLTRIKLIKIIIPGDRQTQDKYHRIETLLRCNAKRLYPSSKTELTRTDDIPGFEKRICAYWDVGHQNKWWAKRRIYYIMSFLLMTWIYRIPFTYATQATCFKVVKKIYAA